MKVRMPFVHFCISLRGDGDLITLHIYIDYSYAQIQCMVLAHCKGQSEVQQHQSCAVN